MRTEHDGIGHGETGNHDKERVLDAFLVPAVLVAGVSMAMQSRANGQLAHVMGEPIDAALWSFGSGWVVLTLGLLLPSARRALRDAYAAYRSNDLRWWMFFGGVAGGLFVALQAYAVPLTGVALFLICVVAGQTTNALVVDRFGIGPGGASPVTPARIGAAGLALVGVGIAVSQRLSGGGASLAVPLLLTVLVGALMSVQTATNGRVSVASGNVMVTTWINFTWGSVLLAAIALGRLLFGTVHAPVSWSAPWWSWIGGWLGIAFIATSAIAVRHLGVLLVMLLTLTGQLLGALLLDVVLPTPGTHVSATQVIGVLVTMLAAFLAGYAAQRAKRSGPPLLEVPTD